MKFIISGGGFIEKETLNILNGIGYKVHNGYGLSEAGIIAVDLNCRINDDPTYVGRVFPLIRTSVDADMNLFVDTFVRKQNNFIFKPFLTNDIATFHNQKLHIIGRKDDIIIGANGENISPNIVEAYFKPLNTPVAAVGVKQHALSDRLVLFIEGNKDLSMTIKEIVNQMPLLYKPREFFLVKKIPLNPLNKVKYFELSDLYTKHYTSLKSINSKHSYHKEKINKDTALIAGEICDYYKVIFPSPIKPIDIYTDIFYDLGASSLDYFMLLAKISTDFKVDIHFQNMTNFKTPLDFAKLIKTKIKQPKS
ncbi:hypothetical protein FACS1894166_10420 [Bacilli bacterium]|nr:hypothetical protein FACS1894166_10420 [Bacilli bacterium]